MRSQQVLSQRRAWELPISSKQQPSSPTQRQPVGLEAGIAAVLLAALGFALVLGYAAASATITRNGYIEMGLREEIEDLRAQSALLRYQIHLAGSGERMREAAARLGLEPAHPFDEVDYVLLPHSAPGDVSRVAAAEGQAESAGIASALAELAAGVVTSTAGRAEASTAAGHRR